MTQGQITYPLESSTDDEVRFFVYDQVGRSIWGEARVRREKSPDVLVLELRSSVKATARPSDWKPVLKLTAHDGRILFAAFGLEGGRN